MIDLFNLSVGDATDIDSIQPYVNYAKLPLNLIKCIGNYLTVLPKKANIVLDEIKKSASSALPPFKTFDKICGWATGDFGKVDANVKQKIHDNVKLVIQRYVKNFDTHIDILLTHKLCVLMYHPKVYLTEPNAQMPTLKKIKLDKIKPVKKSIVIPTSSTPRLSITESVESPQPKIVENRVVEIAGTLTNFGCKNICVVANATSLNTPSTTKSELVTKEVYLQYPQANVYTAANRVGAYTPGDIIVSTINEIRIITFIAEYAAGNPKRHTDTKDAREKWFRSCLEKLNTINNFDATLCLSTNSLMDNYRDILVDVSQKLNTTIYVLH